MATIREGNYIGDIVVYELEETYCREEITLTAGTDYKLGAVLGQVTSDSKYVMNNPGNSNGSQTAAAVLLEDVDATSADAKGLALVRGPVRLVRSKLLFDASINTAGERQTAVDQLTAIGLVANA